MLRTCYALVLGAAVSTAAYLSSAPPARANGILVAQDPRAPAPTVSTTRGTSPSVSLHAHRVQGKLTDRVATFSVEQVFRNHTERRLEGTYVFPLPEGAVVSRFAMTMGGRLVEGEVIEAEEARRIYEGIVRRRRDPGLLEYIGRGLFRAKVFPIEPRSDLMIRLEFQQVLPEDKGTLEVRYPLATDRLNGVPVAKLAIEVDVASTVDVKGIYSPSHDVQIQRKGDRSARVTYKQSARKQNRDLLLYVSRSPEEVGFSLLSHKAPGEDGTFMAVFAPRIAEVESKRVPKNVVYVLDTSGSMGGLKLKQAQAALIHGVRSLREGDHFNIVAFSTGTRAFRDRLVPVKPEIRGSAVYWIRNLNARGGTNIERGITDGLAFLRPEGLNMVVFLTDGRPTAGLRDTRDLVRHVRATNGTAARIFTFGVGYDIDVHLLDRIAEASGGSRDYVAPGEDIEVVTGRFFRRVERPALTDLEVALGPGVYDVYPQKLSDLFVGGQIVIYGRYEKGGPRTITLSGRRSDKDVSFEHKIDLTTKEEHEFLPRLWAYRKVAFLLDEIRLHGLEKELVDEVVRLATRYAIVTPYTAGLVIEDGPERRQVVASENPLFQIGGRSLTARGRNGDTQYRGPGGSTPPGLREPSDPIPQPPPPPTGPPATAPPTTPPPSTPTTPAGGGRAQTEASKDLQKRKRAAAEVEDDGLAAIRDRVRAVAGRTFTLRKDGRWIDTAWDPEQETVRLHSFSEAWSKLLEKDPRIAKYYAVGKRVIFIFCGSAYEVVPAR